MSKDYTVVFPISRECAHQVAMTAAESAARIASPSTVDMDRLGEAVAKAYLQAYEAVEGWTRPQVPTVDVPLAKEDSPRTVSIYRNGNFFSVTFNGKDNPGMQLRIGDNQTATFTLPKDA